MRFFHRFYFPPYTKMPNPHQSQRCRGRSKILCDEMRGWKIDAAVTQSQSLAYNYAACDDADDSLELFLHLCDVPYSEKGRLINAAAAYLLILLHSKALAQLTWYMLIKVSNITKMYIYHADTHSRSALQNSHAGARDFLSADIGNWLSRHLKIYFW